MQWYWVSLITLAVYWTIGLFIAGINEKWNIYYSTGLMYLIIWVLVYPIRAWFTYRQSDVFYKNHGISFVQYLFGKRVKH